MDHLTPVERSLQMARMKSTNTGPEIAVRRLLHALGYRYRIHERNLPGKPDIVFTARRKVIFVHGCFWHQHLDIGLKSYNETSCVTPSILRDWPSSAGKRSLSGSATFEKPIGCAQPLLSFWALHERCVLTNVQPHKKLLYFYTV
jgi:DNA mismatch endonuclease Vsr